MGALLGSIVGFDDGILSLEMHVEGASGERKPTIAYSGLPPTISQTSIVTLLAIVADSPALKAAR